MNGDTIVIVGLVIAVILAVASEVVSERANLLLAAAIVVGFGALLIARL